MTPIKSLTNAHLITCNTPKERFDISEKLRDAGFRFRMQGLEFMHYPHVTIDKDRKTFTYVGNAATGIEVKATEIV